MNWEKIDWAWLLPIAEFAYNNSKNVNTSHTPFELNYGYYPQMLYKEEFDPRFKSKLVDKLLDKFRELMIVYCKNLYHTQEL